MIDMKDWLAYAYGLSNEEIAALIAKFSKIQANRADEKRCAAAKKVVEAINEYLELGEKIAISGKVYNKDYRKTEEIVALFDSYVNSNGYLTFNFVQ